MTNKDLKNWYLWHNKKHFGSKLPVDCDVRWKTPTNKGLAGELLSDDEDRLYIWINPVLRKVKATAYAHMVLVHEMIHALLKVSGYNKRTYSGHGPRFQKEQARLEKLGVIRNLW